MYKILYPTSDATIYSQYPNRNTGVDQILELGKITEGAPSLVGDSSVYADATYNSRILIKFDFFISHAELFQISYYLCT